MQIKFGSPVLFLQVWSIIWTAFCWFSLSQTLFSLMWQGARRISWVYSGINFLRCFAIWIWTKCLIYMLWSSLKIFEELLAVSRVLIDYLDFSLLGVFQIFWTRVLRTISSAVSMCVGLFLACNGPSECYYDHFTGCWFCFFAEISLGAVAL